MKCRIDIKGDLIVEATSETEAFTLNEWARTFYTCDSDIKIIIKPVGAYWIPENDVIVINKKTK